MEQEGKDSSDAVVDTAVAASGDGGAAGSASDGKDDTPAASASASASASDSKSSTSGGGAGGAAGATATGASDGPESIVWPSAVASDGKDAETVTAATIADRLELHFTLPVFTTAIGKFLQAHGGSIKLVDPELEQPLENHEAWQAYSKMVDEQLDAFLVREKLRPEDVVATCNSMQDATPGVYLCAEYILAAIDYPTFLQVMADHINISQYTHVHTDEFQEQGNYTAAAAAAATDASDG